MQEQKANFISNVLRRTWRKKKKKKSDKIDEAGI